MILLSEQDPEEMKREKRKIASREYRKRKKVCLIHVLLYVFNVYYYKIHNHILYQNHVEELKERCHSLNLENKSLTIENQQLKEKLNKIETDLALVKVFL